MNKNFDWKKAHEREDAAKARLNELAQKLDSVMAREVKTEEEKTQLAREINDIKYEIAREEGNLGKVQAQMVANMATFEINSREDIPSVEKQVREAIENNQRFEIKVKKREGAGDVANTFGGNMSGYADPANTTNPDVIYTEQIVEPLYEASILSKVGVPFRTGLTGNHYYPIVEAFAVSVQHEGVELGDSKINTTKLYAKPDRCGVAVPVTRQALTETEGLIQTIFTQYVPAAIGELYNKIICSETALNGATSLFGPFLTANMAGGNKLTYAGTYPTAEELLKCPTKVSANKVNMKYPAYLMSLEMKAHYALTPAWEGAQKSVLDAISDAGYPVVACTEVAAGSVLFGDFKYFPLDMYSNLSIVVDPYSKSRNDAIDLVLNFDLAGTVLRKEAFVTLKKA